LNIGHLVGGFAAFFAFVAYRKATCAGGQFDGGDFADLVLWEVAIDGAITIIVEIVATECGIVFAVFGLWENLSLAGAPDVVGTGLVASFADALALVFAGVAAGCAGEADACVTGCAFLCFADVVFVAKEGGIGAFAVLVIAACEACEQGSVAEAAGGEYAAEQASDDQETADACCAHSAVYLLVSVLAIRFDWPVYAMPIDFDNVVDRMVSVN
jgi:hypothetical protein